MNFLSNNEINQIAGGNCFSKIECTYGVIDGFINSTVLPADGQVSAKGMRIDSDSSVGCPEEYVYEGLEKRIRNLDLMQLGSAQYKTGDVHHIFVTFNANMCIKG